MIDGRVFSDAPLDKHVEKRDLAINLMFDTMYTRSHNFDNLCFDFYFLDAYDLVLFSLQV